MNKDEWAVFSTLFGTSSALEPSSISSNDILKAIDLITPVLYYAFSGFVERGTLYMIEKSEFNPEYILLHIEDLTEVRQKIQGRRLVSIKKWNRNLMELVKEIEIK